MSRFKEMLQQSYVIPGSWLRGGLAMNLGRIISWHFGEGALSIYTISALNDSFVEHGQAAERRVLNR